jgi:ATP-dependent Clp protease ATP-binding subunit ClpC
MPATEPFTFQAREALWYATEEARRFNHEYVGTEHVLLGLLREGGVPVKVLHSFGLGWGAIRSAICRQVRPGPAAVVRRKLLLPPRTRTALEYAIEEARGEGKDVGTEHLLLGLLREQDGVASQVLLNLLIPTLGPYGRAEELIAEIKKRVHLTRGRDA